MSAGFPNDLEFAVMLGQLPKTCGHRRIDRGLTLRDAAAEIGIPLATLHRFERGVGETRFSAVCKVARWLATAEAVQPVAVALDARIASAGSSQEADQ